MLQVPGAEFGAFRWGYTVDPPLPGLTERPLVTRDLLPLGSPPAMDLLFALDDRFQAGVVEPRPSRRSPACSAPTPSGSGRRRVRPLPHAPPRARPTTSSPGGVDGLGAAVAYGAPAVNQPDVAMIDEQAVATADRAAGAARRAGPGRRRRAVMRAKDEVVVVAGSGDGVVDAAAAGLLDGHELVRYAGSLAATDRPRPSRPVDRAIVTDSNRQRAHHWRGSQDVVGFTEDGDPAAADVLREDVADERLDLFPARTAPPRWPCRRGRSAPGPAPTANRSPTGRRTGRRWRSTAIRPRRGGSPTAPPPRASSSASMSSSRSTTSPCASPRGQAPSATSAASRSRSTTGSRRRRARRALVQGAGQRVDLETDGAGARCTITIESVVVPDRRSDRRWLPSASPRPTSASARRSRSSAGRRRSARGDGAGVYVFTRQRTRPSDRWRSDPEPTMVRELTVPAAATVTPA